MTAELAPLTAAEQSLLAECETTIRSGLQTFVDVGRSLARIRDGRLYRQTHTTFENYCQMDYGLSRSRAYQMIDAAGIVEAVSTIVDTPQPSSESQARALSGLDASTAAEVMREAAESGDKVTARSIEEARQRIAPKPVEPVKVTETHKTETWVDGSTGEVLDAAEPTPSEPQGSPFDDPFADDGQMRRLNFQSALAKQITAVRKGVLAFNTADVAELADNDQVAALDELLRSLGNFVGTVRKQRLRVVRSAR